MDFPEERLVSVFAIPLMIFLVAVLLFVALLNNQHDLALLGILVLTLFGGAYLFSRVSFLRLRWQVQVDKQRVFPGETVGVNVHLQNAKFLPIWVKVRLPLRDTPAFAVCGDPAGECGLLWHQQATFEWSLTALRRGVHRLGPLWMSAADLFGLYPQGKPMSAMEIIVYPRLIDLKPVVPPKRDMFGIPGTRSPVQDPVYILGTREYRSGRPARYIHWKASARHNRLQEKIFDPSEQEKVLLVVEVQGFAECGAAEPLERTLEVVASVAVQLDRRRCAFGFACNGDLEGGAGPILPVAGHRRHMAALLELLARIKLSAAKELKTVLSRGLSLPWGTSVMVFSYGVDPALLEVENYFTSRKIPVQLVVHQYESHDRTNGPALKSKVLLLGQLGYDGGAQA